MAINLRDLVARLRVRFDKKSADDAENQTKRGMDRIRAAALKVGAAIAAAFAIQKLRQFGAEAVRVAMEADAIWNRLSGTLATVGIDFQNVEGDIRAAARAMQDLTTMGDEDFAATLTELTSISRDYSASLNNVGLVADLAAAKQIDFRTAAQLVGRAMIGETGTLKRYGIVVKEGEDAVEAMRAQFAGMAENEAQTFAGRLKQLSNEWGDFKEAVGGAMIEVSNGESVLQMLTNWIRRLTEGIDGNRRAIAEWALFTMKMVAAIGKTLIAPIRIAFNVGQSIGDFLMMVVNHLSAMVTEGINLVAKGANLLIDGLNKLPGINIDFRFNGMDATPFWNEADARMRSVWHQMEDVADAATGLGKAWWEVAKAANSALHAQERAASVPVPTDGGAGGAGGPARPGGIDAGRPTLAGSRDLLAAPREVEAILDLTQMRADRFAQEWLDTHDAAIRGAITGIEMWQDAWHSAFDQLFREGEGFGEFMSELGRGIGAAMLGGVSDYARAKSQENIAAAIENAAKAFGALATGNAAAAAAYGKAAATHTAAAVAWSALAGAAASASGAVRGGGGGAGGVRGQQDRGAGVAQRAQPAGPEINIHFVGPGFDALNPQVQDVVYGAIQNATERAGPNAKVRTIRRTA